LVKITIKDNVVIGANAVVIDDVEANTGVCGGTGKKDLKN
jgi:serine acetyltransferase